jgi:hypothetical protein
VVVTIAGVLLRIRWFLVGVMSALLGVVYAGVKVRKARRRLTPASLTAGGRQAVASMLDRTADRIDPPAPMAP